VRATHDLLRYGPAAGLHAIWLASGVTTATPFLGERDRREQLAQFGQRVALAQGSDEAGQLVPLPLAREVARLGTGAEALALFHQVSPPRNDTMQPYAEDPNFLRSLSA